MTKPAFLFTMSKKGYWRDFDVAAGSQTFTLSVALLLRSFVKSTSFARKLTWRTINKKDNVSAFEVTHSV